MTPMIPKMSVSPLATRKSNSPSWTPFRTWIRKKASESDITLSAIDRRPSAERLCRRPIADRFLCRHLAADGRIGKRLDRNADVAVLGALHLAQVEILHRVVSLGQGEAAARTVEHRLLHRAHQRIARLDVAFDRSDARDQQRTRVVALDRINVRVAARGLLERGAECLVLGELEA